MVASHEQVDKQKRKLRKKTKHSNRPNEILQKTEISKQPKNEKKKIYIYIYMCVYLCKNTMDWYK